MVGDSVNRKPLGFEQVLDFPHSDALDVNQGGISGRGLEPSLEGSPAHHKSVCQLLIGEVLI
jgi:hypothetical protein